MMTIVMAWVKYLNEYYGKINNIVIMKQVQFNNFGMEMLYICIIYMIYMYNNMYCILISIVIIYGNSVIVKYIFPMWER